MISRLSKILTYYDSEPTEITQGIIWFIFFPVIYTLEHGLNILAISVSIILGFSTLYAVAYKGLEVRKTMAFAIFLFSIISIILYFFVHNDYLCPTHWGWLVVSFSAFFNLRRITNHYYIRKNRKNG
jgi:hypothetical protein